jgi:ATP-dependent protease ClpP protease subunit
MIPANRRGRRWCPVSELLIYGEIGWECTATDVVRQVQDSDGDLLVRVNSPGGDVYDGLAIMNALRAHDGTVTAVVEGLAASAASFIVVGGADRVILRPTAELMIHDAMSFVGGNAEEMKTAITDLERISDNLAGIYADRAGETLPSGVIGCALRRGSPRRRPWTPDSQMSWRTVGLLRRSGCRCRPCPVLGSPRSSAIRGAGLHRRLTRNALRGRRRRST